MPWHEWSRDTAKVWELIETVYPDEISAFNKVFEPGVFYCCNPARGRIWKTENSKAVFPIPKNLSATGFSGAVDRMVLVTLRSSDQLNTTVYGLNRRSRVSLS